MIYSINTFALSRQNNQESSALHGNVLQMIGATEVASLGINQEFVTQYEGLLGKLTDQVYTTSGSAITDLMKQANAARGKIYSRIHSKLTIATQAEDGHELKKIAGKVQSDLLSKYTGRVPQMAQQEETAVIKGFVFDLKDKLTAEEHKLLGITDDIPLLEKANNDFQQAYLSRTDERADADQLDKTTNIRNGLADLFAQLCINVQYWANNNDADAETKRVACQAFIGRLNIVLSDALTRIHQRRKQGDATDSDDAGNTNTGGSGSTSGSGTGSSTGSGSGSNTGSGSGSNTGSGSGSNTSGSGSGSSTNTGGNDHEIHDGVTEW